MTIIKQTSLTTTVFALLNGMFGGSIMILPLLSLYISWFSILIIVLLAVIINWYSCTLILLHIGKQKDIGTVISNHFKNSQLPTIIYNIATSLGLLTALIVYFKLIIIQIQGLILSGNHSSINVFIVAIILIIWCIITKILDIDTHISGLGFISIIVYFIFLLWMALTSPQKQNQQIHSDTGYAGFTAVMNNALTIQFIFIPILKSYKKRKHYQPIIALSFFIAMFFYFYICSVGSKGIKGRSYNRIPQTIEDYFDHGQWQVNLLKFVYLLHLLTVFPQYLLATKKRVFSLFDKKQQSTNKVDIQLILYMLAIVSLAILVTLSNINLKYIITFSGAVFGFVYCYFIPLILHIKCSYFSEENKIVKTLDESDKSESPIQLIQVSNFNMKQNQAKKHCQDKPEEKQKNSYPKEKEAMVPTKQEIQQLNHHSQCYCFYTRPVYLQDQIIDFILMALMTITAIYVLIYSVLEMTN